MVARKTVNVGSIKQLFLDEQVVESTDNAVRRLHRPRRYEGNPVLKVDKPWESAGGGVYLFGGTVMYDEEDGIFKMWYRASSPTGHGPTGLSEGGYKACYATSTDGLSWEKPNLGLREIDGSKDNNVLPPAKGGMEFIRRPNLIKDYDESDPERRYKMIYMDNIDGQWRLSKGFSPDGINWDMNVGEPHRFERPVAPNGVLFGWDAGREEYVHYHRKSAAERADVDGRTVRRKYAVMRTSSKDFETWGDTREVMRREPNDTQNWSPSHGVDLAGAQYTDDLYVGFVDTATSHAVDDVPEDKWAGVHSSEFANYRTELLVSRDGVTWDRVMPHWEFLRPGLWGRWDRDHVALAKPIVFNDEILIYYAASNIPMGSNGKGHPQYDVHNKVIDGQHMGHAIGLARLRLDGFASMEAYDDGGSFTTGPMTFTGDRLVVNVRAPERPFGETSTPSEPHGHMTVELLDESSRPIEGYTASDSDSFTGDDVRHTGTWNGAHDLSRLSGGMVRLKFNLTNAAVYSFQFRGENETSVPQNLLAPGARGRP